MPPGGHRRARPRVLDALGTAPRRGFAAEVFPRECPFPHKTGTATAATPSEFGNSYIASAEDCAQRPSPTRAL